MDVKTIIKDAILFTNHPELLNLSTFVSTSQTAPTTDQQSLIDLYVRCFNFVYKEIALAYFPLLEKEIINFNKNKYFLNNLQKKIIKIKKIIKNKKNLKYFLYPDYIFCETDSATIIYSYLPEDLNINDSVNLFSGQIIPQVFAYGVAREFEFINGNYVDADMWQFRFKDGLKKSFNTSKVSKLPRRTFR